MKHHSIMPHESMDLNQEKSSKADGVTFWPLVVIKISPVAVSSDSIMDARKLNNSILFLSTVKKLFQSIVWQSCFLGYRIRVSPVPLSSLACCLRLSCRYPTQYPPFLHSQAMSIWDKHVISIVSECCNICCRIL